MEHSKKSEPGAARHGNFPDYYRFNPVSERLKYLTSLSSSLLEQLHNAESLDICDLGCNTGELTVALFLLIKDAFPNKTCKVNAIDIDGNLIDCATDRYLGYRNVTFTHGDIMMDNWMDLIANPVHIMFCFSLTLWIHIHHGDEGLKSFLERVSKCSYLIIEPQPWKCYKTAVRRAKRAGHPEFPQFKRLDIKDNVTDFIGQYLTQKCYMRKVRDLGKTNWDRCITLYEKIH